jgi:hypothetical protein
VVRSKRRQVLAAAWAAALVLVGNAAAAPPSRVVLGEIRCEVGQRAALERELRVAFE